MGAPAPLLGTRVLDLSRLLPGPACTWYLHGLGASIDRIEPPGHGDFTRHVPPFVDGHSALFGALNAGNRSLAIDLRQPEGLRLVGELIPHYDVLIEGFKPGVMEQMGLDPGQLVAKHPDLIVARISGYGQTGPWRHRPGHDINYVGLAGLLADFPLRQDGTGLPGVQIADMAGALTAAMGIAAALVGRAAGQGGRVLDISLAEAALGVMAPHLSVLTAKERDAQPNDELLSGAMPLYGTYRCRDGRWLTLGVLEPKFQAQAAEHLGTVNRDALIKLLATQDRDVWVERLASVCAGPVLTATELPAHPQHAARGALQRVGHASFVLPPLRAEGWTPGAVPSLGQHTHEVLVEAGVPQERIDEARRAGALGDG